MSTLENIKSWILSEALRSARVLSAETLAGCLRHVVIHSDAIATLSGYSPGMELAIYVDGSTQQLRRKYSVFRFRPEQGEIELLIYLHGQGPGSRWAAQLRPGDTLWFRGFTGRITLDTTASRHWFLGDETTLAPFAAMVAAAQTPCEGVIEGDTRLPALLDHLWLPFTAVSRRTGQDSSLINIARALELTDSTSIYIAGAATTVTAVHHVLARERRIDGERIRRKNFWGDKRR